MLTNRDNVVEAGSERNSDKAENRNDGIAIYRRPQIVELGEAKTLVRGSSGGHIRDYCSWYVWGS